jgi:hypothetical protein
VQRAGSTTARFSPKPPGWEVSSVIARGPQGATQAPQPVQEARTIASRRAGVIPDL